MHSHSLESFYQHVFLGERHDQNAKRVWVVGLTAVMMVGEIVGGTMFGSLALVADGWHMRCPEIRIFPLLNCGRKR